MTLFLKLFTVEEVSFCGGPERLSDHQHEHSERTKIEPETGHRSHKFLSYCACITFYCPHFLALPLHHTFLVVSGMMEFYVVCSCEQSMCVYLKEKK
jgi:hypothetical protein